MKFNIITCLIIFFLNLCYQVVIAKKKCPPNSVFKRCIPTCFITCDKPNRKCPTTCKASGCVCKKNYVLNYEKKCVRKDKCFDSKTTTTIKSTIRTTTVLTPTKCTGNKTLLPHMPTCSPKCPGLPRDLCTTQILPKGCACIPPYATNSTGHCILRRDCPLRSYPTTTPPPPNPCKAPWLLVTCRSACPPTCSENKRSDCLVYCLPKGCACVEPYALNSDGECVHRRDCKYEKNNLIKEKNINYDGTCPENMSYVSGRDSCERRCGETPDYSRCVKVGRGSTCECRYPYALNNRNECVHESQCFIK
uniref:TIL domain-containing protein n=2 Tax=Strongyloides stercoralis TaxID=6248 RepID=A0A0K0EQX8_STRER